MHGTVKVYIIWYGTWDTNSKNLINNFVNYLPGTSYWNINGLYTDATGPASVAMNVAGSITDNYSLGKSLTENQIYTLVKNAITGNSFVADANAIYVVLTAADVTVGQFCTSYCGE